MKIGCYGAIEFQGLRGNCEEQFFKSTASSLWVNKKTTGSRNKKNIGWEKTEFFTICCPECGRILSNAEQYGTALTTQYS